LPETNYNPVWSHCSQRWQGLGWENSKCRKDKASGDMCAWFNGKFDDTAFSSPAGDGKFETACLQAPGKLTRCALGDPGSTSPDAIKHDTAPPGCIHVPTWASLGLSATQMQQAPATQRLIKPCEACPEFTGETAASQTTPKACCVAWTALHAKESFESRKCVQMSVIPAAGTSACNGVGGSCATVEPTMSRALGHTGGGVQDVTILSKPGPAGAGSATFYAAVGMDDSQSGDGSGTVPAGWGSSVAGSIPYDPSGFAVNMSAFRKFGSLPVVSVHDGVNQDGTLTNPAVMRAFTALAPATGMADAGTMFAVTNGGGDPRDFLRLAAVVPAADGGWKVRSYPTVVEPASVNGKSTLAGLIRWDETVRLRGLPRVQLLRANDMLAFSAPGVGVAILPVWALPTPTQNLKWPTSLAGKAPLASTSKPEAAANAQVARFLAFEAPGKPKVWLRACETDIAYIGGALYATVGQRWRYADSSADGGVGAAECADLPPGLYRAEIPPPWAAADSPVAKFSEVKKTPCDPNAPVFAQCFQFGLNEQPEPVLTLISGLADGDDIPKLHDPTAIAAYAAPGNAVNWTPYLVIADQSVPGAPCRAALWRVAVGPSGATTWRVLTRMDGIQDVEVGPASPGSDHLAAAFVVRNDGFGSDVFKSWYIDSPSNNGFLGLNGDHSTPMAGAANTVASLLLRAAPRAPGVYNLALPVSGPDPSWMATADASKLPAGACDGADVPPLTGGTASFTSAANGQMADCLAGETSPCVALSTTRPGALALGTANAGANYSTVAVSPDFAAGIAVGTWHGEGAYWLPPAQTAFAEPEAPPKYRRRKEYKLPGTGWYPSAPPPRWAMSLTDATWRPLVGDTAAARLTLPAWLQDQVSGEPDPTQWQPFTIPATSRATEMPDFSTMNGEFYVVATHAASGPSAEALQQASGADFMLPNDPAVATGLTRVHVTAFTAGMPDGARFLLNGTVIGEPANGMTATSSSVEIAAITGHLRAGRNTLGVTCPPSWTGACSAEFGTVETAEAVQIPSLEPGSAVSTNEVTVRWFSHAPSLRRHATWLAISLIDPNIDTYVRWNEGPALRVQDGSPAWNPDDPAAPRTWRVAVDAAQLRTGENTARFTTAPCASTACPTNANMAQAAILADYADDPSLCAPTTEICNAADDDCDGATDEASAMPCDDDDRDGCDLGRQTCDGSGCTGDTDVTPMANPPQQLYVALAGADAIFADGSVQALVDYPPTLDVFQALTSGATFPVQVASLPPSGSHQLQELVLKLGSGGA
jgi:hypothetical protein